MENTEGTGHIAVARLTAIVLVSLGLALGACGGGSEDTPEAADTADTADTDDDAGGAGTGCADTVELVLDHDRAPVDATFVARGGGAYADQNGDFHVVFGTQPFGLAAKPPDDLVTVSMLVPLGGVAPAETTYTSADDGLNLDLTRRDAAGSISTSFGLEGTGDDVSLAITELGDGFLCATVAADSNPAAETSLQLDGTIEVPYGEFEDLISN